MDAYATKRTLSSPDLLVKRERDDKERRRKGQRGAGIERRRRKKL
jgi:hypothetical protein